MVAHDPGDEPGPKCPITKKGAEPPPEEQETMTSKPPASDPDQQQSLLGAGLATGEEDGGEEGSGANHADPAPAAPAPSSPAVIAVTPTPVTANDLHATPTVRTTPPDDPPVSDGNTVSGSDVGQTQQERRGRSRSPRNIRSHGASGTITEIPPRSRSPTPTRGSLMDISEQMSPAHNHTGGGGGAPYPSHRGAYALSPPAITYDKVNTAPNSPTAHGNNMIMSNFRQFGSSNQLHHNKAVMVTPSGSLLAVNQSPLELRESSFSINYPDAAFDDGEEISLLYTRREKIPMKDFAGEIRASLDVESFLNQAHLMLDVHESDIDHILESMLVHLLNTEKNFDKEIMENAVEDAKKSLFTQDSVRQLAKTIQGTCYTLGGNTDYDQSWVCALCTVPAAQKRHVAIARLRHPLNLGRTSQEIYFIILVVTPTKEKGTKNVLETGRTFATLFADMDLRLRLLAARSEEEFKSLLWDQMKDLADEQSGFDQKSSGASSPKSPTTDPVPNSDPEVNYHIPAVKLSIKESARFNPHGRIYPEPNADGKKRCWFGRGIREDFCRRIKYYISDFKDGILERGGYCGHRTPHKTASTTVFLYFAIILPSIALGVLNDNNTQGFINVKKVIYMQTIGGLYFHVFGGQHMVILMTTAPLALFTKVIVNISEMWDQDFTAMYACVGLWNSFFLLVYAFTDASRLMKWSTRSTEEIFALFISIAFTVDAFKDIVKDFNHYYESPLCDPQNTSSVVAANLSSLVETTTVALANVTEASIYGQKIYPCMKEHSLLFLLLAFGTVWLGLYLFNFTKTPFLNAGKRELLADYALPVAVLIMSFFGSYVFRDIPMKPFSYGDGTVFNEAPLHKLTWIGVLISLALGFCLSLLFLMDQNISAAMVNSPDNRLKKGTAYHWDLMVVALLNAILTFFGMPMMHGALPHSPLHVRAMADVEDRVDQGHIYQKVIYVRETRVTGIISHILIGLSIFLLPYPLAYIPRAVLNGLFLYLAITALNNNQMFERIMLLFTEQSAYPPNHYIRKVPQRKVHLFTILQILQLGVMCGFGFSPMPYLKMVFPVLLLLLLPIRHKLVPVVVDKKFLSALDG